jgi:ribosomal protein S18 acetylase RimI-like enzyme
MSVRIVQADPATVERAVSKFMNVEADGAYATSPTTLTFVALDGAEIAGWCWGYQLVRPDNSTMLYLHQLEVDEAHRRQGIARQLMTAFMKAGAATGATKMLLSTGADNTAARALYESMGGGPASQGATVNYWFKL